MDLQRMLDKCRRDQWSIEDLDWTATPRSMAPEEERTIVQYFTNMSAIERLAKALFEEQRRRVEDPVLKKIFSTFIADEERHAEVALRLASHYDLNKLDDYQPAPALVSFRPHFLRAIQYLSAEVANTYITAGELMLDGALLRSLDDLADDSMSKQAMHLINRDESRHIAIDYYMCEFYASEEYAEGVAKRPGHPLRHHAKAMWAFFNVLFFARPFFIDVFIEPMRVADPTGRRLSEAFKRLQLLLDRPGVAERPFSKFINGLRAAYKTPRVGALFGEAISRLAGAPGEFLVDLYSPEEQVLARSMTIDDLAQDALAAKTLH